MNAPEQLFSAAQSFLLAPHDLETGKLAGVFGSLLSHELPAPFCEFVADLDVFTTDSSCKCDDGG